MCVEYADELRKWDKELRAWQTAFNQEVLASKGIFVKTQSHCWVTHNEKGEKHRHYNRWISFALTPEHVERLRKEPTIFGDIESGCCGGPDEHTLTVHP